MASAGSQNGSQRRIMRSLTINEISAVDRPAQDGARALLMKREGISKRAALTDDLPGHSHLLHLDHGQGELTSGSTSYSEGHDHPWILTDTGIMLGQAKGRDGASHTHGIAAIGKTEDITGDGDSAGTHRTDQEDTMTDAEKKVAQDALDKAATLEAELAVAKAYGALTDAEKAHYDALPDDVTKAAWLAKSTDERKADVAAEVKKATDTNPVIFKDKGGTEYRQDDDPRLVALARSNDALVKRVVEAETVTADVTLRKRAETDFKFLPGGVDVRMALIKGAESIEDEDLRKKALESLAGQNDAMSKAFKIYGVGGDTGGSGDGLTTVASSAEGEIEQLVKARMAKSDVNETEAVAYDEVLKTPEGKAAYGRLIEAQPASAA